MKHVLSIFLLLFLSLFLFNKGVSASCLTFQALGLVVTEGEWPDPNKSLTLSCPGDKNPGQSQCTGTTARSLKPGGNVTLDRCSCLQSKLPKVEGIPEGCEMDQQAYQELKGENGDIVAGQNIYVKCPVKPTEIPTPTDIPPTSVPPTAVPPTATLVPAPVYGCNKTSHSCDPLGTCTNYDRSKYSSCGTDAQTCSSFCAVPPTATTAPTSVPPTAKPAEPTPTPTVGQCFVGKSCSNCNGNSGSCRPDCNGGWCNGGQCVSCQVTDHCTAGVNCSCKPTETTCDPCKNGDLNCKSDMCRQGTNPQGTCSRPTGWQRGEQYICSDCGAPQPTGIQPTTVISMPTTPTPNPTRPVSTPGQSRNKLSQRWVCLKAEPCSNSASGCSGQGIPDHRVKLSAKTEKGDAAKPLSGKLTYIFECLQTASGHKCTLGDLTRDQQILGTSVLPELENNYGYTYNGMYQANGVTAAANPIPVSNNNNGNIGVREWESYTDSNVNRIFLAMNEFDINGLGGEKGAQQQGVLAFVEGSSKTCTQIKWDPAGVVTDESTGNVVENAEVLLLRKDDNGKFDVVTSKNVLGGITNPIYTDINGEYNFFVPDGTYRIQVKKQGYQTYTSKDIVQKNGEVQRHDIKLKQESKSILNTFQNILEKIFTN